MFTNCCGPFKAVKNNRLSGVFVLVNQEVALNFTCLDHSLTCFFVSIAESSVCSGGGAVFEGHNVEVDSEWTDTIQEGARCQGAHRSEIAWWAQPGTHMHSPGEWTGKKTHYYYDWYNWLYYYFWKDVFHSSANVLCFPKALLFFTEWVLAPFVKTFLFDFPVNDKHVGSILLQSQSVIISSSEKGWSGKAVPLFCSKL